MALSLEDEQKARTEPQRRRWLAALTPDLLIGVHLRAWWYVSRPEQRTPPGEWLVWLLLTGRGWGKTRTGAEWLVEQAMLHPFDNDGQPTEWGAFAETLSDARAIMVEGPAGLLRVLDIRRMGTRTRRGRS